MIVHAEDSTKVAERQSLQEAVRLTTGYLQSALLKVLELPVRFDAKNLESDLLGRDARNPHN